MREHLTLGRVIADIKNVVIAFECSLAAQQLQHARFLGIALKCRVRGL
ncbi:hypothetical protein HRbin07_00309 [bacterium HR07]|nr:hypothetical protein HRbin07_00309 [bacterium HR07]